MLINVAFDWLANSLYRIEDIGADDADILAGLFNSWATAALEALFPAVRLNYCTVINSLVLNY